jgi:hypothetical protein
MKWSDLAEMHLLLREHGWEPLNLNLELELKNRWWTWVRDGRRIVTTRRPSGGGAWYRGGGRKRKSTSVLALRRVLKRLAEK